MIRRPPRSTRTDTLFPYTTLFLSGGGGHAELLFHRLDQLHHLDEGLAADRFDDLLVGKGHLDYLCYLKLETAIDLETREPNWVCRVIAASAAPTCFRPPSAGRPRWCAGQPVRPARRAGPPAWWRAGP